MIMQNVHTGPNLRTYYIKPMLYNILIYIGRVHLIKYNSSLHLKGRKKRGNELICRFRPAPDAIRLASQIRHSSGITSARFQPPAGADSPAEACATFSWKPFHTHGIPVQLLTQSHGLTFSHQHYNYLLSDTLL
ncbi:hypothetical protein AHAS_Ahas17G0163800 [Arachis hypogaea]